MVVHIPLTQILNVLIANDRKRAVLRLARSGARAEALEYNDTISDGSSNKGGAVRVASPSGVVVEGYVGQAIADGAEQQGDVACKPPKLESLHQRQ